MTTDKREGIMTGRRNFVLGTFAMAIAGFALPTPVLASQSEIYVSSPKGIAINGYDPVAYFTQKKPVEGSAEHSLSWKGATWHFSSAENKSSFEAAPEKFAPQYGGYCAFAVSYGSTATTVPEAWTIVDKKLYLNYSIGVRSRWSADQKGHIAKADKNWPGVLK